MGQRRRFTPEFKRQAVQLLNAGQRPAAEIARELGIPRNRLYKWQKAMATHGGPFQARDAKPNPRQNWRDCGASWRGSRRSGTS